MTTTQDPTWRDELVARLESLGGGEVEITGGGRGWTARVVVGTEEYVAKGTSKTYAVEALLTHVEHLPENIAALEAAIEDETGVAPVAPRTSCGCGCGQSPKGKRSMWMPGHDARRGGHAARQAAQ